MQDSTVRRGSTVIKVPGLGFISQEGGTLDLDNEGQRIIEDKLLWNWM